MIYYKYGDATELKGVDTKIIVHIVNDAGKWGAGFTRSLSKKFPEAKRDYLRQFEHGGAGMRLGEVQLIKAKGSVWVANMVAQHGVRGLTNRKPLDLKALEACLEFLARFWVDRDGISFHMPRIGCGLAGGTWDEVRPILERTLGALHVDITVYDLQVS